MLTDHVAQFFNGTPILLRQIGRISAPIFIFTACVGFKHTKSKINYLKNLYIFSFFMSIISAILNFLISSPAKSYITNNIFSTLLLIDIFVFIIETTQDNKSMRNNYIFYFALYNFISIILHSTLLYSNNYSLSSLLSIFPNIIFTEGGTLIFCYGVLTYFYQDSKVSLILINIFISLIYLLSKDFNIDFILNVNYQWMMIFSLPFILVYNKTKGKGYKYFFYFFYPVHIFILFILSSL